MRKGAFRGGRRCVDQIFTLKRIGEKAREKKRRMHVGFIDLEKPYDRVNREVLWQVLRMYDEGSKRLSGNKSIYIYSSAYVRIKVCESDQFRIDSRVKQGCIMSPFLFSVYMDGAMKEVKMGMGRRGTNLRKLLGIRRMNRVPNAWMRDLCGVRKGLDERIDEGILRWFGYVVRIEGDWIAKRVYVGD